jgi:predicted lipid-binding transport protein (Tim44 family)
MGLFDFFKKTEVDTDANLPIFEKMFLDIQAAVDNDDERTLKLLCTDEMYKSLMQGKADNVRNDASNVVEDVTIKHIFTVDTDYDEDLKQNFHEVQFQFTLRDYYVDGKGELLSDSTKEPQFIEEIWVFTQSANAKSWYLSDIKILG